MRFIGIFERKYDKFIGTDCYNIEGSTDLPFVRKSVKNIPTL